MLRDVEAMPEVELKRFCLPFRCRNAASTAPILVPWYPAEKDIWANELPPVPSQSWTALFSITIRIMSTRMGCRSKREA